MPVVTITPSRRVAWLPLAGNICLWMIQLYAVYVFVPAGYAKVTGAAWAVQFFGNLGLGQWFRYFTGLTELTGAALLLTPWLSAFGALLLSCTMVGAIITHVFALHNSPLYPLALLVLLLVVAAGRRGQLLAAAEKAGLARLVNKWRP